MSHTTDDMIFEWDPEVPIIVVEENIELPQLQLVENRIADCTQVYSTGMFLKKYSASLIIGKSYSIDSSKKSLSQMMRE